jgi:UDP-glucose:(heptosyl)LPS alpha-1,3-glucosyltransferase
MAANRFRRWRDARSGGLRFDVVYSPGINCLDPDAVTVHVVFHELVPGGENGIFKMAFSWRVWLRRVHRLLYYRLLMNLENEVYKKPHLAIAAVSRKTASEIERHFGRKDVRVIHNGVDLAVFNPKARLSRRAEARQRFAFRENEFVVLLIGNDWNSKGLPALLQAAAACAALPLQLLVVGEDDRAAFREALERLALASRVRFEAPAADVMQFYAAADLYVSPSLHDSFALPVAEAMACALPVVTSAQAGISALLHDGVDSFILRNPRDAGELARLLRRLYEDSGLRQTLGENAARAAQGLTWEKNAALTRDFLEAAMLARDTRKSSGIL